MTDATPTTTRRSSALRIVAATVAFALVHSLLASRRVKNSVRHAVGDRARDGWYRVFFNAQALATFGALTAYIRWLPDRTLYDVHGPMRALMRAGQLAGLAFGVQAAREVGVSRMAGATSLAAWARGAATPPSEPEAQGPAPDASGLPLRVRGPFAYSRHPLNFAPLPVLWLNPRMSVNFAAFNAMATLYLVIGSWHEEQRLLAAYGDAYEEYRRSGVPFYLPLRRSGAR